MAQVPLGTRGGKHQVPSMLDKEGCLWPELHGRKLPKANEVDIELRAHWTERARWASTDASRLHMGGVFESPALMAKYIQLGI